MCFRESPSRGKAATNTGEAEGEFRSIPYRPWSLYYAESKGLALRRDARRDAGLSIAPSPARSGRQTPLNVVCLLRSTTRALVFPSTPQPRLYRLNGGAGDRGSPRAEPPNNPPAPHERAKSRSPAALFRGVLRNRLSRRRLSHDWTARTSPFLAAKVARGRVSNNSPPHRALVFSLYIPSAG